MLFAPMGVSQPVGHSLYELRRGSRRREGDVRGRELLKTLL